MVFLCDIQETFRTLMPQFDIMTQGALFFVEAAKALKIPIVATEQKPFKPTAQELDLKKHAIPCFQKTRFSMLIDEVRDELKRHAGVRNVFLIGIEAHVCILQTALDLLREGYNVYLVTDCVYSQHEVDRNAAFKRMHHCGVNLTTAESAVYELMGDSTHPLFKAILPFTKKFAELKNAKKSLLKSSL